MRLAIEPGKPTSAFLLRATDALFKDPTSDRRQLESLTQLVVKDWADWGVVELYSDQTGGLAAVSTAHADPVQNELVRELFRKFPTRAKDSHGSAVVVRTSAAELDETITEAQLGEWATCRDHLGLLKALEPRSRLCLPLSTGARPFGVLTLISTDPSRAYTLDDLAVGLELAERASLAIRHARTFHQAQVSIVVREEALEELRRSVELAEQKLKRRTEQLAAARAEHDTLGQSVVEGLRGRLLTLLGCTHALETEHAGLLAEFARRDLGRVGALARGMASALEDLDRWGRVASAELHPTQVDVTAEARSIIETLKSREPARQVEVTIANRLTGCADPALMRLFLESVLGNAWKFTRHRPDARIDVTCTRESPVTFQVRDNGEGFDMADAGRLFLPFARLHPSWAFEGNGFGLAISRRIIVRHGGWMWAQSTPEGGTSMTFSLGPV